jgi:molybdenum cofactor cytidylyltransferase
LIAGIAALPESVDGALICLADMPLVTHSLLDRLIEAFEAAPQPAIVVPLCNGTRGNPILWHRRFWPAFSELSGDRGARAYLDTYARHVTAVETCDDSVLRDFDTPGAMG